ncbi:MBL fold metallo-hydrolase [Rhodococcus sp. USK13]|jgi:ribonuclease BN (tRNA processing enzyme)|uniref:MBL fold metallo-hydrolase n=1 Tax=Rhodococcus sp. USK13 TaxID=2806442 RepID=UPI001BCE19D9|nr:MBL fold metallo-hydrolase [Rhodococcus sp. USK13]
MCLTSKVFDPSNKLTRRGLLAGAGSLAAAVGLSGCSSGTGSATLPQTFDDVTVPPAIGEERFEIILLGTQGGPPIEPNRTGISTAVVIEGQVYLVDCGRASASQYVRSGLQQRNLNSIFLTHLHADHVSDFYDFFLAGGTVPNSAYGDWIENPVHVHGPGPAGGLPPKFGGGEATTVGTDPTPGTIKFADRLHDAFAYSTNMFLRDSGIRDVRTLMDITEIGIPEVDVNYTTRAPSMTPFTVMEDDRVRVTAVLVPHGPVFPSFAFRFDTDYGSVTFSGDTAYSENVIRLANRTDLLVHEAINLQGADLPEAFRSHMLESHVEVQRVGSVAEQAGARRLVLSHVADITNESIDVDVWNGWAQEGYGGDATVGSDLQRIQLA